jgi:hypothetical protein
MAWLERTPVAVLDALAAMMPRIEAHEAQTAATVVGVGHSYRPGSWAKRQLSEWSRTAGGGRSARKAPPAGDLAGVGIKLTEVSRG